MVRKLAFLTQRQIQILAAVVAIVGFIATVIGIIVNFPTLLHIFGWH